MFPPALSFISRVLPVKLPGWMYALIAGAVLGALGMWKVMGWYQDSQVTAALKFQIERERKIAKTDQDALKTLYESRLKIAQRPKVVRNEIVNLLPADCALGPDVVGLLNAHRADLPETTPGTSDRSWLRWQSPR